MPLHAQVESLLRDLIRSRQYPAGELLPDEVTLARMLGISRNTLRAGIMRLSDEGLLERKAGVGTRVASQAMESGLAEWQSFTHEMERKGVALQSFLTQARMVEVPQKAARSLKIDAGRLVCRIDRLRGWNDQRIVHFRSYLHPRLGLHEDQDFSDPLYEIIEKHSRVIAERAHEEMRAVEADAGMASLLRVPRRTPLLQRNRTVFDAGGRPIEYSIVHYLSRRFALTLDIQRSRP